MSFIAIMEATPDSRVAKYQGFSTEAEADAHVAKFTGQYLDAFVVPEPAGPFPHWLIDMAAKTVTIVPPPPPDFSAIDQATVDRLLLESGVMRAFALMMSELGKAVKTGNWTSFDDVTNTATYKTLLMSMLRLTPKP